VAQSDGRIEPNEGSGAAEPITLNDPDGSVTRVAPWSTRTREQVRAPGGEPALVTHLEAGQLWFAAGRPRSPWRHEIRVGPAIVSTPRGRFHVTAEPDGGATIVCLAGRTRIVAGLREPVLLGPDQTAAVSSDGATLVVMDRTVEDGAGDLDTLAPDADAVVEPAAAGPVIDLTDSVMDPADLPVAEPVAAPAAALAATPAGAALDDEIVAPYVAPRRRRRILAEVVAVAALVTVLVAAAIVFSRDDRKSTTDVAGGAPTATTAVTGTSTATTDAPAKTTTSAAETATTEPKPQTTAPPATVAIVSNPSAKATYHLDDCKRSAGGVTATVSVTQSGGGAASFKVEVGLVDEAGAKFASGTASSPMLDDGATTVLTVPVANPTQTSGYCEFIGGSAV
jgi:hypothetical protein